MKVSMQAAKEIDTTNKIKQLQINKIKWVSVLSSVAARPAVSLSSFAIKQGCCEPL
jgi:hypothetical protein